MASTDDVSEMLHNMEEAWVDEREAWADERKERDALIRELVAALSAANSVMWMAREYAEAGGSGGPEVRDYAPAEAVLEAALARAKAAGYEVGE